MKGNSSQLAADSGSLIDSSAESAQPPPQWEEVQKQLLAGSCCSVVCIWCVESVSRRRNNQLRSSRLLFGCQLGKATCVTSQLSPGILRKKTMANPNHPDYAGIKVVANGRDGYIAREQDGTIDVGTEGLQYDENTMHKVNISERFRASIPLFSASKDCPM